MIKFLDLKAINRPYEADIKKAFDRIIDSGWYLLGKELQAFETDFAKYCQVKHVVGVASGLDAMSLSMQAYDIGRDDEVIVPSNTYIATVLPITASQATPVFVEPDPKTLLIDPAKIEEKITAKTKAIMPVHLYGRCCDMPPVFSLAKKYSLKIIDDAAQAHGAISGKNNTPKDFPGRAIAYSFYPSKNLGALADAGAVATNDSELAEKLIALRNYGSHKRYYNKYIGSNSRLDEIQAAILNIKLKGLDDENTRRRNIAAAYLENIKNKNVTLPTIPQNPDDHVWHLFVITAKNRDGLRKHLEDRGIQSQIHYPIPPHKQQCYPEYNSMSLPIAEQLADEVLSLPISPVMTNSDVKKIAEVINDWN